MRDVDFTGETGVVDADRQCVEALLGDDGLEVLGQKRRVWQFADTELCGDLHGRGSANRDNQTMGVRLNSPVSFNEKRQ